MNGFSTRAYSGKKPKIIIDRALKGLNAYLLQVELENFTALYDVSKILKYNFVLSLFNIFKIIEYKTSSEVTDKAFVE